MINKRCPFIVLLEQFNWVVFKKDYIFSHLSLGCLFLNPHFVRCFLGGKIECFWWLLGAFVKIFATFPHFWEMQGWMQAWRPATSLHPLGLFIFLGGNFIPAAVFHSDPKDAFWNHVLCLKTFGKCFENLPLTFPNIWYDQIGWRLCRCLAGSATT